MAIDNFEQELRILINRHSIEKYCNMPDFILAEMVVSFIQSVGEPIKKNQSWHANKVLIPGGQHGFVNEVQAEGIRLRAKDKVAHPGQD